MDYTFILSMKDVQVIYTGLGELLLKNAAETFGKLSMQLDAQDKERQTGSPDVQPPGEHSQAVRDAGSS